LCVRTRAGERRNRYGCSSQKPGLIHEALPQIAVFAAIKIMQTQCPA
jgi:hypothetical protein